jgi:hypothetical protein
LIAPVGVPVSAIQIRFSQPARGEARRIHATAPRYDGVTNVARIVTRTRPFPGMLVRVRAQAIGSANTDAKAVALTPRRSEFTSACRCRARLNATR